MKAFRLERSGEVLLDIGSFARQGPQSQVHLTPAQVAQIHRTVTRVPEVVIKVTSGGGATGSGGIRRHLSYIGRRGELAIETDDGDQLQGRGAERRLIEEWDLDLEQHRKRPGLTAIDRRSAPKLVHRLIFSMPAGTPSDKVLSAVRSFAREEFGLKHRYAMVLHTDEPHPHVHVVVKAVSEDGVRLNIRKATLRGWRLEFARHLREYGIAANATDRAVRGQVRAPKTDGVYRAYLRGDSMHMRERALAVVSELAKGKLAVEPGQAQLLRTRREVTGGWRAVANMLRNGGQHELASRVDRFVGRMPPPLTDKQWIASRLMEHARARHGPQHEKPYSR